MEKNIQYVIEHHRAIDHLNGSAKYAAFNKQYGELILLNDAYKTDDYVSLRDAEYAIIDGILYIRGTQIYWKYTLFWEPISWNHLNLYELAKEWVDKLEIPEESILQNVKLGWWIFKKKREFVFDRSKNPNGNWLKYKKEDTFSYCLHPFKIKENE